MNFRMYIRISINITRFLSFELILEHHELIAEIGHNINLLYQLC